MSAASCSSRKVKLVPANDPGVFWVAGKSADTISRHCCISVAVSGVSYCCTHICNSHTWLHSVSESCCLNSSPNFFKMSLFCQSCICQGSIKVHIHPIIKPMLNHTGRLPCIWSTLWSVVSKQLRSELGNSADAELESYRCADDLCDSNGLFIWMLTSIINFNLRLLLLVSHVSAACRQLYSVLVPHVNLQH